MPDFTTLVIICAVMILVLNLVKATAKLIIGAVCAAVVIYIVISVSGGTLACHIEPLYSATPSAYSRSIRT